MRNLKRALSLALASVMVLGMMVVGAGAVSFDDFSDKDKVVNVEAVTILNNLNVINGKDDGSFDPTGIVTRAEMAKMICVILNGGKDPNLGSTATTSYTDTVGNWAAGYIEFCTNQKIVGGDGTGKFNPANTVTGQEAAKMLLVAMGYDATYEKMTGAQWATSVNVLANTNGLYDGLTIDPAAGLTRDDAAQMIYNALDVDMVQYDNALVTGDNGTLTSIATVKKLKNQSILTEIFGAVKVEGVVVGNEVATLSNGKTDSDKNTMTGNVIGSAMDAGKTSIKITNGGSEGDQNKFDGTKTFSVSTGMDDLGRSVYLYVKPTNSGNSEKSTVIGGAILSSDNKVVKDYSGDPLNDSVADDNDFDYKTAADDATGDKAANATQVAYNYGSQTHLTADIAKTATAGVEKILIDNDGDGTLDYVFFNTYMLGKVTKYTTKDDGEITVQVNKAKVTDSASNAIFTMDDADNVVGFDDVKKDDYVMSAFIGGKLYVDKAETVVGDLTAYKQNSSSKNTALTVDGTRYDTSFVPAHGDLTNASEYDAKGQLDKEATFYLDKAGRVVAVGDVEDAAYSYALLLAHDSASGTRDAEAKVVLEDGTTATYVINSKNALEPDELTNGYVYAYSVNSSDEIKFSQPAGGHKGVSSTVDFTKGKTAIALTGTGSGTYYSNNSTVFFYVDDNQNAVNGKSDVKVYTGRNSAPSADKGTAYLALNKDGDVVAAVFYKAKASTSAGDNMFIYNNGDSFNDYTIARVVLDTIGDKDNYTGDIEVDAGSVFTNDKLYLYTTTTDGYYELETAGLKSDNGNSGTYYVDGTDYYAEGEVIRTSSSTVVLKIKTAAGDTGYSEYEFNITNSTLTIDNVGNPSTPTVTAGGSPSKGDTVQILLDDDDILTMVITKNAD